MPRVLCYCCLSGKKNVSGGETCLAGCVQDALDISTQSARGVYYVIIGVMPSGLGCCVGCVCHRCVGCVRGAHRNGGTRTGPT